MRGRLINKFILVLRQLDTAATAVVVGGGYDDEFGEDVAVDDDTQLGASSRRESDAIRIECQVDPGELVQDSMTKGGHEKVEDLTFLLHREELEDLDMMDANGNPTIYSGDRIEAIEDDEGNVQWAFDNLFVKEAKPAGYGLAAFGTPEFNLVEIFCMSERQEGSV